MSCPTLSVLNILPKSLLQSPIPLTSDTCGKYFLLDEVFREQGARRVRDFQHNKLRPHVKAGNRIVHWSSSFYVKTFLGGNMDGLSNRDLVYTESVLLASLTEDTRMNYGAGLLRFHQFCDYRNIEEDLRVPASVMLLKNFVAHAATGKVSDVTVWKWLAGLRAWHLKEGATWNGEDAGLKMTIAGVRMLKPKSSSRIPRPPVTIEHIRALRNGLDLSDAFDIAVWAVAATAFWACCRLGELTVPNRTRFDPIYHASKSSTVTIKQPQRSSLRHVVFDIPWTKAACMDGATIIVTEIPGSNICPIAALEHHLAINGQLIQSLSAPRFAYHSPSRPDSWAPMQKDWFMARCNSIWVAAGLSTVTGHSFRIGGATEHLLDGAPPAIVQRIGRWESDAFMVYWRKLEDIIPMFLAMKGDARPGALVATLEASKAARRSTK